MGANLLPWLIRKVTKLMLSQSRIRLLAVAVTLAVPVPLFGQIAKPELKPAIMIGTATDANGDPVPNATIELKRLETGERRTVTTPESGFFEFRDVQPGVPYEITVTAQDFVEMELLTNHARTWAVQNRGRNSTSD